MANQMYGYDSTSYGGAANYTSRSIGEQYLPGGQSSFIGSSRYFGSDTLPSHLSSYSSLSDRGGPSSMLFSNHDTSYSAASARIGGGALTAAATQALWPPGVDVGTSAASVDSLFASLKRSSSEALYHQTVLGAHNTTGQSEAWYSTNPSVKRPRFESASNLPIFPQRPGEKDCAHYMLTRTCKFGDSCKFDHPIWVPEGGIPDWKEVPLDAVSESLPERPGEPDCPYFLKTQRCKFGLRCKFNHPTDKTAPLCASVNAESSSLPDRPFEPPCAFYLKTGKCKFGPTCKFHHPRDISIPSDGQENGRCVQTEALANGTAGDLNPPKPLFTTALLHNSKGLPIRLGEVDCPFYLKTGSCKYGATCHYNHPDRLAINPPIALAPSPGANLNIGLANPAASVLQAIDPRLTQAMFGFGPTFYPQRPGQVECDFYMKTGECKFGERCKYHHPIDRSAHTLLAKEAHQQNIKLTLAGLPRREGAMNCPYYMKTGACKYGATCKFDHPPPGEVMAVATSQGASTTNGGEGKDDQKVAEAI